MPLSTSGVTFLLGSGVSIPSGYPSTADITGKLFLKDWSEGKDPNARYLALSPDHLMEVDATRRLLRLLRNHVDQHLALHGRAEATYEDIYFLAQQILDSLNGEYENPGLLPWLMDLRAKLSVLDSDIAPIFRLGGTPKWQETENFRKLVQRCLDHIEEAVAHQLAPKSERGSFGLLDQIVSDSKSTPLRIVTLNHDTLLDRHFADKTVQDGFRPFSEGAQIFDQPCFDPTKSHDVLLLKLHGSIDWFRYQRSTGEDIAVKVSSGDRDHIIDDRGQDLRSPTGRLLLAGTTNKELAYGSGVFLELMFQFHELLRSTDLLIVSGYGFADKGINNRLWAWLDARPQNRMLALHEKIDELRTTSKPSFGLNMVRQKDARKFAYIDKWLCDCTLDDVNREIRLSLSR